MRRQLEIRVVSVSLLHVPQVLYQLEHPWIVRQDEAVNFIRPLSHDFHDAMHEASSTQNFSN
jgi:hypothetical protein